MSEVRSKIGRKIDNLNRDQSVEEDSKFGQSVVVNHFPSHHWMNNRQMRLMTKTIEIDEEVGMSQQLRIEFVQR